MGLGTMIQSEIQFFWPLTEQIPLDLDYTGCDTKPESILSYGYTGVTFSSVNNGTWTTAISPTLTVSPTNPKGYIEIGGLQIGQEKEPNFIQKLIFKLLGFNWKGKQ